MSGAAGEFPVRSVGIVGLGPTAGILAIALHSMGTYGKLYAEAIEAMDPLRGWLNAGDVVLLKASRGVALERLLPSLEQENWSCSRPSATASAHPG